MAGDTSRIAELPFASKYLTCRLADPTLIPVTFDAPPQNLEDMETLQSGTYQSNSRRAEVTRSG